MTKFFYKLCIYLIKILPDVLALLYLIGTIFSILNIDLVWLSYIGFTGMFSWLLLYITSFTFKFCVWHRLPLYYILVNNVICYIDYIFFNPVPVNIFIIIHLTVAGIFFISASILKYKNNGQKRNF